MARERFDKDVDSGKRTPPVKPTAVGEDAYGRARQTETEIVTEWLRKKVRVRRVIDHDLKHRDG